MDCPVAISQDLSPPALEVVHLGLADDRVTAEQRAVGGSTP
jgi:hypothetical protein